MNQQDDEEQNETWESIKYCVVCDRWGDNVTTITYNSSNHFRINPNIEYQYLTEEEVREAHREERRAQTESRKRKKVLMTLVFDLAEQHLTPTQQVVLIGYLQGKTWMQMANERGCSESAIRQVFWGNSRGEGGLVQKLKNLVAADKTTSTDHK